MTTSKSSGRRPTLSFSFAVLALIALSLTICYALAPSFLHTEGVFQFAVGWALIGVVGYLPSRWDSRARYREMPRSKVTKELLATGALSAVVGPFAMFMVMATG